MRSTTDLISRSNFIVEGLVKKNNFKPAELKSCQVPKKVVKKVLKYKITVTESLGKEKLPPGDYDLSYEYICDQHPENPVFEEGKSAIFAIKSVKDQTITLVGHTCDWWGWDVAERPRLLKFLK